MAHETPLVECSGLYQEFDGGSAPRIVLDHVDCVLHRGRMVALMGPSGSGKSTLLNVLGGLVKPTSGHATAAGVAVESLTAAQATAFRGANVGFVFQEWNLVRDLTILENVMLPLRLRGQRGRAAHAQALAVLTRVGIGDRARMFPDACSGGEQQRASIARAIVDDRPLLLADEPTGALDARNGARVLELMRQIVEGGERSILIATHDPAVAAACDDVWRIHDGRLTADDGEREALDFSPAGQGVSVVQGGA